MHTGQNKVLEDDVIFLHAQESESVERGGHFVSFHWLYCSMWKRAAYDSAMHSQLRRWQRPQLHSLASPASGATAKGDNPVAECQLAGLGDAPIGKVYHMPGASDAYVTAFRSWLQRSAGGGPFGPQGEKWLQVRPSLCLLGCRVLASSVYSRSGHHIYDIEQCMPHRVAGERWCHHCCRLLLLYSVMFGRSVMHVVDVLQAAGPRQPREELLDRYHSHTKHCKACSGALRNTRRGITMTSIAAPALALASAVAAAAALSGGLAAAQVQRSVWLSSGS